MDKFMLNNNISKLLAKTYGWMVYALLVSGAIAGILGSILMATPALITNYLVAFIIAAVAELILVWTFGNKFDGMSYGKAFTVFTIFSALNGITLAPIFVYYTAISIATTFFITAGMFAIMSLIGYFTKIDLSKFGGILLMCLIGLIIASIVNITADTVNVKGNKVNIGPGPYSPAVNSEELKIVLNKLVAAIGLKMPIGPDPTLAGSTFANIDSKTVNITK